MSYMAYIWHIMAINGIHIYNILYVCRCFVAKKPSTKNPPPRLSRHSDATRIGETLGTYRATSSTPKWPRRSSRSTNALVGTLARIGWQQVWQGRFATWHLKIVWVDVFRFFFLNVFWCIWIWASLTFEDASRSWQVWWDPKHGKTVGIWDWIFFSSHDFRDVFESWH